MRLEVPRALLVAPVFVYLAAVAIMAVHPLDALVGIAIAATAMPLVPWLLGRTAPLTFVASPTILAVVGLTSFLAGTSPTGPTASLDAGVILASPLWFLAAVLDSRREPGVTVFSTVAGLTVGALLLASLHRLSNQSTSGPSAFLGALGSVLHDQSSAIVQLLGGTVPANIPLSQVADPLFAVLGVAAGIGVVAPWLEAPAIDELLEKRSTGFGVDPRSETTGVPLNLPPEMDRRLDEGSTPVNAPRPTLTDLGPLLAAAFAALGFVALAAAAPSYALLAVGGGAVLSITVVVWAIRGPRPPRGSDAARSATPPPGAPPSRGTPTYARQLQR